MAILRAGPFASSSDSHLDEPGTPDVSILPVNCAMSDWVSHSWRCWQDVSTVTSYVDGPSVSESDSDSSSGAIVYVEYRFYYQATIDASMNIAATLSASGADPMSDPAIVTLDIDVDGTLVTIDDEGTAPSLSVDTDYTLPSAIVPKLVIVSGYATNGLVPSDLASVTLAISPA